MTVTRCDGRDITGVRYPICTSVVLWRSVGGVRRTRRSARLAVDQGKAGLSPAVLPEIAQRLLERGKQDSFADLFNHRSTPSKVVTPPRILGATARLLARRGCDRRALLREVGALVAQDNQRKRLAKHPQYVPLEMSLDAGPTEVEDDAVGLR